MNPIVVIGGLPGSGKSTVARGLARRLERSAVVEGDYLQHHMTVRGLVGPGDEPSAEAERQLDLRWKNLAAVAANFHDEGFTTIVDSLVIPRLLAGFRAAVAPRLVAYVHLDPDRATGLDRDAGRGAKRIGDRYDYVAAEFGPLREAGPWIDSTHQTPEETVAAVAAALGLGQLTASPRPPGRSTPAAAG